MYYWNKDNFEGLDALADHLSEDARLSHLAEYCRLRAIGLRDRAFEALDRFLDQAEQFHSEERYQIVDLIYELAARSPQVHQFITTPITIKFLRPGLASWLASQPDSIPALRWDGIFNDNSASLERALAFDPHDVFVRRLLINRECLSSVFHGVHHIDESILLLDISEIDALLAKGKSWLEAAPDRSQFSDLEEELSEQQRLISDWKAFCKSGEHSFPEWCAKNGRHHDWIPKFYYEH